MWPFRKRETPGPISPWEFAAVVIAAISLAVSAGVFRWSWLLLDEQLRLRKDLVELQSRQDQVEIQYEYWLKKLQEERKAVQEGAATKK